MYDNNIPSGGNSVVECLLAKEDVASSSLVSRSILNKETGSPDEGLFLLPIFCVHSVSIFSNELNSNAMN